MAVLKNWAKSYFETSWTLPWNISTIPLGLSFELNRNPTAFARDTKAIHYVPFCSRCAGLLLPHTSLAYSGNSACTTQSHPEFRASSTSAPVFFLSSPIPRMDKKRNMIKKANRKRPLSSHAKSTPTWFWNYRSFHSRGSEYPLRPEWLYHTHRLLSSLSPQQWQSSHSLGQTQCWGTKAQVQNCVTHHMYLPTVLYHLNVSVWQSWESHSQLAKTSFRILFESGTHTNSVEFLLSGTVFWSPPNTPTSLLPEMDFLW